MSFDPFSAVFDLANTILQKWFPDANLREEAAKELAAALATQVQGQIDINKIEASSPNWFIAGWRPYLGWVCNAGFTYVVVAAIFHLPPLDPQVYSILSTTLGGLLGVNILARTVEKYAGVQDNH
jgi:hypothetical protein